MPWSSQVLRKIEKIRTQKNNQENDWKEKKIILALISSDKSMKSNIEAITNQNQGTIHQCLYLCLQQTLAVHEINA